jgi:hypothetical protein
MRPKEDNATRWAECEANMRRMAFWSSLSAVMLSAAVLPACAQQDSFDSVMADCGGSIPPRVVDSCLERVRVLDETNPSPQLQSLEAQLSRRAEHIHESQDGGGPGGYGQNGPPQGYGNDNGQGPPPGYGNQAPQQGYGQNDEGPPPGYGNQGPPPNGDQDQGASSDEQRPPDEQTGPDDQPPPDNSTGPGDDGGPPDTDNGPQSDGPPADEPPPPDDTSPQ